MKKTLLFFVLLATTTTTWSQDYKFGKVSKEELSETSYSKDPDANAVVLYREMQTYYDYKEDKGIFKITEVFERIKICKKEGFKWATRTERLYDENNKKKEDLKGLKAYTYNLEDGKVVKDKLRNEGIFEEKVNKYWKEYKFTMPNIKEGSVIEYEYRLESPFIQLKDDIFQYDIPIQKFNYRLRIPEYYTFNMIVNPKADYIPTLHESQNDRDLKVAYTNSLIDSNGYAQRRAERHETTISFKEREITAQLLDIPALKDEVLVDNLNNYRAKINWDLIAMKGFDGSIKSFSKDWDKVVQTIYESDDFGGQLEKSNYFEKDISNLISDTSNQLDKASLIYDYVKSKVKWNGFSGYHSEVGVKKAYSNGSGNVADINLMLTAMLRYAGMKASPVLISTRDNGIPLAPTTGGFNYVIAAIEVPNGIILLDASSEYATANILPKRILNWQGRIVRERGSSAWISLAPKQSAKEVISLNAKINNDLSISGKVRKQNTNHLAMRHRGRFNGLNNDEFIRALEEDKGALEILNLETKNADELSKPVQISYDYTFENGIEDIGGRLYLTPLLFFEPDENPFKQNSRQYPIDFSYPVSNKYMINIMLPEGYQVESLPENAKIQFNTTDGDFTYLVKHNGSVLQFTIVLNINKIIILPQDYELFKKFIDLAIEKQTEKIVLKKV